MHSGIGTLFVFHVEFELPANVDLRELWHYHPQNSVQEIVVALLYLLREKIRQSLY